MFSFSSLPKPGPFGSKVLSMQIFFRNVSLMGHLKPAEGSTRNTKRLGRGPASGHGKTSGRGHKGQKARGHIKSTFEGGQTPLFKLLPKIGFKNPKKIELTPINLTEIKSFIDKGKLKLEEGEVLTMQKMKECKLISGSIKDGVKILSIGAKSFNHKIKIEASRASAKAIAAIESAGGEFTAKYFTKLSLRSHLFPNWYLRNKGYVPLLARPISKRHIEYYSSEKHRGYLLKENYEVLKIRGTGSKQNVRESERKSALQAQLSQVSDERISGFTDNKVVSFSNLGLPI